MKILLLNAGYCSGLDGSVRDYVTRGFRYLRTPSHVKRKVEDSIGRLVRKQKPDICCFLELHKKTRLPERLRRYAFSNLENKYGERSILRRIPFFKNNCNGFFSLKDTSFEKMYFKRGAKKLVYEIKISDELSLIMCHFSLTARTRKKQFSELSNMIRARKSVIVCGDFNVFRGSIELAELLEECNMSIVHEKATFPSARPNKSFDLFLCSPDVKVKRCDVVKKFRESDHLPVILEVA